MKVDKISWALNTDGEVRRGRSESFWPHPAACQSSKSTQRRSSWEKRLKKDNLWNKRACGTQKPGQGGRDEVNADNRWNKWKTETRPLDYATQEEDYVTHTNLSQWSHGDKGGLWRYTRVKERRPSVEIRNWVVLLWSGRVKWNDNQMGVWREMMFSGGRHDKMSVHWWEEPEKLIRWVVGYMRILYYFPNFFVHLKTILTILK